MKRIVSALLVFTSCAFGQFFEVASIRLHKDQVQVVGTSVSGQRLNAEAMSLEQSHYIRLRPEELPGTGSSQLGRFQKP